jgi:hypothetical protein
MRNFRSSWCCGLIEGVVGIGAFSDQTLIRLGAEQYVDISGNTLYQARYEDTELYGVMFAECAADVGGLRMRSRLDLVSGDRT